MASFAAVKCALAVLALCPFSAAAQQCDLDRIVTDLGHAQRRVRTLIRHCKEEHYSSDCSKDVQSVMEAISPISRDIVKASLDCVDQSPACQPAIKALDDDLKKALKQGTKMAEDCAPGKLWSTCGRDADALTKMFGVDMVAHMLDIESSCDSVDSMITV